jgi:hypothetical protein
MPKHIFIDTQSIGDEFAILIDHSIVLQKLFGPEWRESSSDTITIVDDIELFRLAIAFYNKSQVFEELNAIELALLYEFSEKWCFELLARKLTRYQADYYLVRSMPVSLDTIEKSYLKNVDVNMLTNVIDDLSLKRCLSTIQDIDLATLTGVLVADLHPEFEYILLKYDPKLFANVNGIKQAIVFPEELTFIGATKRYLVLHSDKYLVYYDSLNIKWNVLKFPPDKLIISKFIPREYNNSDDITFIRMTDFIVNQNYIVLYMQLTKELISYDITTNVWTRSDLYAIYVNDSRNLLVCKAHVCPKDELAEVSLSYDGWPSCEAFKKYQLEIYFKIPYDDTHLQYIPITEKEYYLLMVQKID